MKAHKRAPSVIVVRGFSGSEETNVGSKCKVFGNSAEPFGSEDEQDPSTMHKRKAKSQQSSRPTKRMASSLDTNTTQPSNLKAVKPSLQTRSLKKNPRLQIISLPNSESSDEDESEIHPPKDHESRSTPVPIQDFRPNTQIKRSIRTQIAQSRAYSDKHLDCITYTNTNS